MRLYFFLISLLIFKIASAQVSKESEDVPYDKLILKHKLVKELYAQVLGTWHLKNDTLITKDSIVITMLSKKHLPLQRVVNFLDSSGCVNYVRHKYYNLNGLVTYIVKYSQTCPVDPDPSDDERKFHHLLYERFEYDDSDSLTLHVYNKTSSVTYRETYYIDESLKKQVRRKRIHETEFWR